jgi:hypothetical protein
MFKLDLCASNLHNQTKKVCQTLNISNLGYGGFIEQEIVNFFFLVMIPLLISIMTLVFGIVLYKRDKNKRIRKFETYLKEHIRVNDSLPLTVKKNSSFMDSIY